MALHQTALVMTDIFRFVKKKNQLMQHRVQAFVMDKHGVEWERCFYDAKVLHCQFHALIHWQKILGRKFGLKPAGRYAVQRFFANMLYSPTDETYGDWNRGLMSFAMGGHPPVRNCFGANWRDGIACGQTTREIGTLLLEIRLQTESNRIGTY